MNDIREKIVNLLCELLEGDKQKILDADNLLDLGFDSIIFVKLIVELELAFGIECPDDLLDLKYLSTVDKIVQIVENLKN